MTALQQRCMLVAVLAVTCVSSFVKAQGNVELPEICLGCLCEAASRCNATVGCNGDDCGMFRITRPYWDDADRPVLSLDNPDSEGAYERCTKDPVCATQTVRQYMNKFAKDCNGDGTVDCQDFAAIHRHGGYENDCKQPLNEDFSFKFYSCLNQVAQLQAAKNAS